MKNKSILIVVLAVLVVASIYFFNNGISKSDDLEVNIIDTSKIATILIAEKNAPLKILKNNGEWMVNETFHADKIIVKRLLRVFKNLEIQTFVADENKDSIANLLRDSAISITFIKDDEQIAKYWIGNFNKSRNATLVMKEGGVLAYVLAPGLTVDIGKSLSTDEMFWRDKRIFDFEPNNISKIELIDFTEKVSSFNIEFKNDKYHLSDFLKNEHECDLEKIKRYLSYFKNITYESIIVDFTEEEIDSIIHQQPLYTIKITSSSGSLMELQLIPKSLAGGEQDLNRVYGLINSKEPLLVINYVTIDLLLKSINYFN